MCGEVTTSELIGAHCVLCLVGYALYTDIFKVPLIGELKGTPLGKLSFLTVWINILWVVFRFLVAAEVWLRFLSRGVAGNAAAAAAAAEEEQGGGGGGSGDDGPSPACSNLLTWGAFKGEPLVGGAGLFLTLAYYGLVHFDSGLWRWFEKMCKEGVIPYSLERHAYYMHLIHLPHFFLALLAPLVRHPDLLLSHLPDLNEVLIACVAFGIFYICCVMSSYYSSGFWPYPFFAAFTRWYHHALFYAICSGFLSVLALVHRSYVSFLTN